VTAKLNEMWAAFEAHKPKPKYADAWATMLKKRTMKAAWAAFVAAPAGSAVKMAAWWAAEAVWGAADAAAAAAWPEADHCAQEAIDAIKEVKP
jgi:hypothetical protein